MPSTRLTNTIIEAAIDGFEAQKQRIDGQIAALRAMLDGAPAASSEGVPVKHKRRKFSAEARRRMKEAQRLRWAKIRGESGAAKPAKTKRRLSAAGRKSLADSMRKRWAAKKAQGTGSLPAAKKAARKKAA